MRYLRGVRYLCVQSDHFDGSCACGCCRTHTRARTYVYLWYTVIITVHVYLKVCDCVCVRVCECVPPHRVMRWCLVKFCSRWPCCGEWTGREEHVEEKRRPRRGRENTNKRERQRRRAPSGPERYAREYAVGQQRRPGGTRLTRPIRAVESGRCDRGMRVTKTR